MKALASIFESLATKAVEYMVDTTAAQLSHVLEHDSKFQNLCGKVQELKDARQRVQQSVDEAIRNGEKIFDDVERWLTMVNDKISDQATTQSQEDETEAMQNYFARFLRRIKDHYQVSKNADKEAESITQLLNEKDRFDSVSYRPALEGIDIIRPLKEYQAFESRSSAFDEVMVALEDGNVNIIGVYGMGGVGKTALVKEAARRAKDKKLFDEVILVAITQALNISNIQNEILEKLGLKIEERSVDVRAARLRDRLKKVNKVLIILDDIWEEHDLEALGIPFVDIHEGLKILMTSRKLQVLKSMGSQKSLPINILKEDEAWQLFKIVAGPIAERSDLQSTANKVAQKCAGLPIAIATVAKALKHKENLHEWEDALEQLKPSEINFRGITGAVYSAIEMSYKYLKTEDLKSTFLLCSIMGHNAAVEDLLKYSRGLGLFRSLGTIQKVRNRVLTLVRELKDSCLLLAGSTPECFDMHDVVCDVAISIASRDRGWLALGKEDVFEGWSDVETMRNYNLISLQHTKDSELPDELECPNLTFFSMLNKDSLSFFYMVNKDSCLTIPSNFFKGVKRLKVLSLEKENLSTLTLTSIGSLRSLGTLRLIGCDLEDVVMLGELVNLEILDLRKSTIRVLPKEIGQLRRLKLLDMSGCFKLEVISPNVLSSLSRLEELYLHNSFHRWDWEIEGNENNPRSNAGLVELQNLSRLTTLEVHVLDVRAIPKQKFFSGNMERFKISIGQISWSSLDREMGVSRILRLTTNPSLHLVHNIKTLLRKTQSLYLNEVKYTMEILSDPISEGFPDLKHLAISNVSDIKFVVNPRMLVSSLESLFLVGLMNLEAIWDGQLKAGSFGRLRFVRVNYCEMLKNLFSFSTAKGLRQLEEIGVYNNKNMRGFIIVEKEEIGEDDILEFTQLRSLTLDWLPAFNGMWYSQETFQFAKWLFDKKVLFPAALEKLSLKLVNGIEKIWHDDQFLTVSCRVQSLTHLEVFSCRKLKCAFTSSMVESLVHLKTVIVKNCDEMEDIIEGILGGEERINSSIKVFPKLDYLELHELPNLKTFCRGSNPIEFPSLRKLEIWKCLVLSTFHFDIASIGTISLDLNIPQPRYLFSAKVLFPALKELYLDSVNEIEKIWHDDQVFMMSLTHLKVVSCHKLKCAFTSSMVESLLHLKTVIVGDCDEIEDIIEGILGGEERINNSIRVFPKLDSLKLIELPNLKIFCGGINPIEFPFLRKLEIWKCPVLSTFHFDTALDLNISQPQYLFSAKVIFPVLEELGISCGYGCEVGYEEYDGLHVKYEMEYILEQFFSDDDYMEESVQECLSSSAGMENVERLWPNLLDEYSYSKLTSFFLEGCPKLLNVFPLSMLTRLQKLENLKIWNCKSLEEICESQSQEVNTGAMQSLSTQLIQSFPCLTSLTLFALPNLKSVCHKTQTINWPLLKKMEVCGCNKVEILFASQEINGNINEQPLFWVNQFTFPNLHQLTLGWNVGVKEIWRLVPSSTSFHNLVGLEVKGCHGIIKFITHSTAKSLVQLGKLSIVDCQKIEEIVGGGDDDDEISFPQLNNLRITSLPKLESFCSSWQYTFDFPSLETISVKDCPNMKTFSQGELNTPILPRVILQLDDSWEGNLNSTIQQFFREQNNMEEEFENSEEDQSYPCKKQRRHGTWEGN